MRILAGFLNAEQVLQALESRRSAVESIDQIVRSREVEQICSEARKFARKRFEAGATRMICEDHLAQALACLGAPATYADIARAIALAFAG